MVGDINSLHLLFVPVSRPMKNDNIHYYYTIIDLCLGGHGVLLNSKLHIDRRGAEVNMIKFAVQ